MVRCPGSWCGWPWLTWLLLRPSPATARRRPRRADRRRDPRSRPRGPPGGIRPCRGASPASPRGRRRGLRGCGTPRAQTRPRPSCPSGIPGYARGPASRRRAPLPGRRAGRRSPCVPAARDLRRPLVYLLAGEDALLDEQLLRRRDPALVVAEAPVPFGGQALLSSAVLVCGLQALCVQGDGDGVGQAFPVFDLVPLPVDGAGGRAAEVVRHRYPTLWTSFMGGRSTSSSTYSCSLRPSGVATACRKSENWKSCSGRLGSLAWSRRPSSLKRRATARSTA